MSNKVTVLGLIVAMAFIFTSCTKDTDVIPADRFAAPTATLDAPTLKNEYAEADNGWSMPSIETAPVAEPGNTQPPAGYVNRNEYAEADNGWSMPSTETAPVAEPGNTQPSAGYVNRNEYAEMDNGWSMPSIETAPVLVPGTTPPTVNHTNRNQDLYYMGERGGFNGPAQILPVNDQPSGARNGLFKDPYPIMPVPSEPHVVPYPYTQPVGESTNYGKLGLEVNIPDCGFPVVSTQNNSNVNY